MDNFLTVKTQAYQEVFGKKEFSMELANIFSQEEKFIKLFGQTEKLLKINFDAIKIFRTLGLKKIKKDLLH